MHVDWDPPHLSLVACYILQLLVPLPCRNWFNKNWDKNWKSPAFDARRTLGMSNLIIIYNLLNILLLLIDLDVLTTILPKTDVPYPWIWLLYLVSINSACRLSYIITAHLRILVILLLLSTVAKEHSIATTAKLRSLKWLIPKTPLLLMW